MPTFGKPTLFSALEKAPCPTPVTPKLLAKFFEMPLSSAKFNTPKLVQQANGKKRKGAGHLRHLGQPVSTNYLISASNAPLIQFQTEMYNSVGAMRHLRHMKLLIKTLQRRENFAHDCSTVNGLIHKLTLLRSLAVMKTKNRTRKKVSGNWKIESEPMPRWT